MLTDIPCIGSYHSRSTYTVLIKDRSRQTIPVFLTHSTPIMQVHRLPIRIVSWVKRPSILVKLVREDQNQILIRIFVGLFCVSIFGRVPVDQAINVRKLWYLAGRINAAQVESPLVRLVGAEEVTYNWIAFNLFSVGCTHLGMWRKLAHQHWILGEYLSEMLSRYRIRTHNNAMIPTTSIMRHPRLEMARQEMMPPLPLSSLGLCRSSSSSLVFNGTPQSAGEGPRAYFIASYIVNVRLRQQVITGAINHLVRDRALPIVFQ